MKQYKHRVDKAVIRALVRTFAPFRWRAGVDAPFRIKSARRIVVVWPHLLGDAVMIIPFLRAMRESVPECEVVVVCGRWTEDLLRGQGLADVFVTFGTSKGMTGLKNAVKNRGEIVFALKEVNSLGHIDAVVDPYGNGLASIFASRVHADFSLGAEFGNNRCLLSSTVPFDDDAHFIDNTLSVARLMGCVVPGDAGVPRLKVSSRKLDQAKALVKSTFGGEGPLIGVHPGASVPIRKWGGYSSLIDILAERLPDSRFFVFGGPGDKELVDEVISGCSLNGKRIARAQLRLDDYLALLAMCDGVVCNDSSCGHLAAAIGTPVTVLFGKGDPEFIAPRGFGRVNVISRPFECRFQCLGSGGCVCDSVRCLEWINPETVAEAVLASLE